MMQPTQIDFEKEMDMDWEDRLNLIDLIDAIEEAADDEAEVMATLRYMIETDHVRLFGGAPVDLAWAA